MGAAKDRDLIKVAGLLMLLVGAAGLALANVSAPEIDPSSAVSGITLLSGVMLVLRDARKKKQPDSLRPE